MEEPNGDELAPNVSPPARSNRVVFGALTVFILAAVGLAVVTGYVTLQSSSPVLYQFRPTIVTTQQPITGNTISLAARWCNETTEPIEALSAVSWQQANTNNIVASDGGVQRFEPGCNSTALIATLPEQVRTGTWIRLGAATYEHNGETDVVHFSTEEFTVAR